MGEDIPAQHMTHSKPSKQLVEEYDIPQWSVGSTKPLPTCCGDWKANTPDLPFVLTYDRIFTNFDSSLETLEDDVYKTLTSNYTKTPPWAEVVKKRNKPDGPTAAYHHPVMARLTLSVPELATATAATVHQ